jgi:hypothetical protein
MSNTQGGPLEFEFDIKLQKFEAKLNHIESQLGTMSTTAVKQASSIDKAWGMAMLTAGAYFAGRFIGNTIRDIVKVRGEFEKLEAVLTNTFGDNSRAKSALAMIQQFAAKTPFQVTDLTDSFVKLVNQGFEPTMDDMTALGDLASSTGKGFDQLSEAILDAQTMQFERLKEFGIKAEKEGDKIVFTFKQQKTAVDANSASIQKYILSLGKIEGVSGSMEAISKTMVGKISNMKDAWDQLLNTLGNRTEGPIKFAIEQLGNLLTMLTKVFEGIEERRLQMITESAGSDFELAKKEIEAMAVQKVSKGMTQKQAEKESLAEFKKGVEDKIKVYTDEVNKWQKQLDDLGWIEDKNLTHDDKKQINQLKQDISFNRDLVDILKKEYDALLALENVKNSNTGGGGDGTDPDYDKKLKAFEKNLSEEKKLYQQFEAVKSTTSLENAKRLYPKLEDSYKEFLLKLREKYQDNPAFSGVIATELAPIFKEEHLEQLPRIEAFWEKQKAVNLHELKLSKSITAEHAKKLKSLTSQAAASADLRSEWEKERDLIQSIINLSSELLQIFKELTDETSQAGMAMGNLSNALQSKSIAEGFIKFGVGVIKDWIQTSKRLKEEKIQIDIDQISASLAQLTFQLDNVDRALDADKVDGYRKSLTDLRNAGIELERQFNDLSDNKKINWFRYYKINFDTESIEDLQKLIVTFTSIQNTEDKKENEINKQRLEQLQEMLKLKQQELDIHNDINEALTGTTSSAISDAIAKGFEDGLTSVDDFANIVEDTLKKAIIKGFQAKFIEPYLLKWYNNFAAAAESGGELTEQEATDLKDSLNKGLALWTSLFAPAQAMMDEVFGVTSGSQSTLAGAISSIQEDTANVLAGTLNSMRIIGIRQAEIADSSLRVLNKIEFNTSFTKIVVDELRIIKSKMSTGNDSLIDARTHGR